MPENEGEWKKLYVIFVTAKGKVRKNSLIDFLNVNASGKIAMKLDENDKIIGVEKCKEDQDIILGTNLESVLDLCLKNFDYLKVDLPKGIRGINLPENDNVMSLSVIDDTKKISD